MLAFSSCIGDEDSDEHSAKDDSTTSQTTTDDTEIVVDSSFYAPNEYLTGEWIGEYVGYDAMQDTVSTIRRQVNFSDDGYYSSVVQGIIGYAEDEDAQFNCFEREQGHYTYDASSRTITYKVEYDSLINFRTNQMEYNPGKVIHGVGVLSEYSERVFFSPLRSEKRQWVRTDEQLKRNDNHSVPFIYLMNRRR